jgi:hypothetical protein
VKAFFIRIFETRMEIGIQGVQAGHMQRPAREQGRLCSTCDVEPCSRSGLSEKERQTLCRQMLSVMVSSGHGSVVIVAAIGFIAKSVSAALFLFFEPFLALNPVLSMFRVSHGETGLGIVPLKGFFIRQVERFLAVSVLTSTIKPSHFPQNPAASVTVDTQGVRDSLNTL